MRMTQFGQTNQFMFMTLLYTRQHDPRVFSEYDIFLEVKESLCICYIYNFVSSWLEMGV